MCAICGIYGLEDSILLNKMCKVMEHRGPDGKGLYLDNNISLGHRRLSIIDLSTGDQPIHNEDESIWVVFNGEIYNYLELRKELEKNHKFYTSGDTETLVHLYEDFGENMAARLNGMFAFAIWDSGNKNLLLFRDPLGKKPLYYFYDGKILIFASEIKAILEAGVPKEIDLNAIGSYLAYQYVLGERTLFKGIKKLPPGHYLVITRNVLKIKKYWDITENLIKKEEHELIGELRSLLEHSARYRSIADVSIGGFLSGGIDSSAAIALIKPFIDYEFHTFSIGFETFSELNFAKLVSEHLDTKHHEIMLTDHMVLRELNKIAWHYDEPIGDAAIISNYFLSKEARKFVKVVVAGEAGDELFGGYLHHEIGLKFKRLLKNDLIKYIAKSTYDLISINNSIKRNRIKFGIYCLSKPCFEKSILCFTRSMSDNEINYLCKSKVSNLEKEAVIPVNIKDDLNRILAMDCKNLLPEKFLMKADKSTMANSIEERLPLMDKNIVEFAFSIPYNLKIRGNINKYILRRSVEGLLPDKIIFRKKQGFGTPKNDWMKGELKEVVSQDIFDNELIKTFFKNEHLGEILHNARPEITWTVFALGLWFDTFFKN